MSMTDGDGAPARDDHLRHQITLAEARHIENELKSSVLLRHLTAAFQKQYDAAVAALPEADATDHVEINRLQNMMRLKLIFETCVGQIRANAEQALNALVQEQRGPHPD